MKFLIITVLAISIVNPIVNAHENHDHKIYSWSNSKSKTIEKDNTVNSENLKDNAKTNNKSRQRFLEDKSNS